MPVHPSLSAFIAAVPKVELHVHLVGSATASAVAVLAERHGSSVVPVDEDAVRDYLRFVDFAHFVEVYSQVNALVTTQQDVVDLVDHAAASLAAQNVRYAEMTVTPHSNVVAGIPYPALVEALADGRSRAARRGVELAWVYDIAGEQGPEAAEATTTLAVEQPPEGLVGFGLGGLEAGVDRAAYASFFDRARAAGLRSVPHAGEGDGPASVWAALGFLRADRIGHGVRAIEDPRLVDHLVAHRIPLEVCVSSNICTNVYASVADHPVGRLRDAGVLVTLNSDDPPMFSTTLAGEYELVAGALDLGLDDVAGMVADAITASFLPDDRKQQLVSEARAVADRHR